MDQQVKQSPELRGLTEKLTAYIKRMRDLRSGKTHVDSLAFFKSVEAMENEICNLKNLYENEMDRIRLQVEELSRQKHHYQLQAEKHESLEMQLQQRLTEETQRAKQASEETRSLQVALREKDMVLNGLNASECQPDSQDSLHQARRVDEIIRENMDLKRRYEAEQLMRREEEDKRHQLLQRMKFEQQLYEQQCSDLQQRIESATNTILSLESRLRAAEIPSELSSLLDQVRDTADREMQKYKADSEESFNKTISMLKAQMDADNISFHALTSENRRLLSTVEELNATNHRLQSEITHLQHVKRSAEENLRLERTNSEKHILSLENKLQDLQAMLFNKLKELNSSKDSVPVLHAEIESIRRLLHEDRAKATPLPSLAVGGGDPTLHSPSDLFSGDILRKRMTSAPTSAGSGRISPRRPLSGGPVGPIAALRPNYTSVTEGAVIGSEVNTLKLSEAQSEDAAYAAVEGLADPLQEDSKPSAATTYDFNVQTNSATGDIKIYEVHPSGKYVRLQNTGQKDIDLSGYLIQQNVGGHPVAVFRFPSRISLRAGSFVTVYSASNDPILHQPPIDFVWTEQKKWGTGPECTTIICKPNGQAIAWTTAAHRFGSLEYPASGPASSSGELPKARLSLGNGSLPVYQKDPNKAKEEALFLRREKTCPPVLEAQKHPHGESPARRTHPMTQEHRPMAFGNDNSSNNPQSRCQSKTPDAISGQPYAGASGQQMGSAKLLRFVASQQQNGNIRKSGALTKQAEVVGRTAPPPSSFMKPHARFHSGVEQLRSQLHHDFLPPMPRPPLFSAW